MKANKLALLLMLGLVGLASCGGGTSSGSASGSPDTPTSSGGASTSEVPTSSGGGISEDSTSSGGGTSPAEVVRVAIAGANTVTAGERITLTATVTGSLNTNVTWSGGQTGVATINSSGEVVAAADVSVATPVTFRATSVADSTAYAEHVVTVNPAPVPEEAFKAEIVVVAKSDEATPVTSMQEDTGAIWYARVDVEDLPGGKSLADCTFTWPNNTAIITYNDAGAKGENYRELVVQFAGTADIEVSVKCGDDTVVAKKSIEVTRNDALYTEISTAAAFIELLEKKELTGRYKLTKNLDLNGYVSTAVGRESIMNAELDGDGHTISNFVADGGTAQMKGGLWYVMPKGIVRNTHFIGEVNAVKGQTGLLAFEIQSQSIVENCIFEAKNTSQIASTWPAWERNGAVTGVLKGRLKNIVALSTANTGTVTIDDQLIAIAPYAYSNTNDHASMDNVYTNKSKALSVPFDASGSNEWGMVGNDFFDGHYTADINFANVSASVFSELPTSIWTIADNKVPALAHDGETPDVVAPQVTVNATSKSMRADATYQIVADTKFFSSTPTITYTSSNTAAATVNENGLVTGVAEGEATITVKATAGAQVATATVVITVTSAAEPVPDVSARYTVTEIFSQDNGAWLRYKITAEAGQTITVDAVQHLRCYLSIEPSTTINALGNAVGLTTVEDQVLTVGINYNGAAFHVDGTVTSVIILTIDQVDYSITTVFTSQANMGAATYDITSSVCAIVE